MYGLNVMSLFIISCKTFSRQFSSISFVSFFFFFYCGKFSKDTRVFHRFFSILLWGFHFRFICFFLAFSHWLYLYSHLSNTQTQHFRSPSFLSSSSLRFFPAILDPQLCSIFSYYSRLFLELLIFSPYLLVSPHTSGIPVFFVSSGPFPHS